MQDIDGKACLGETENQKLKSDHKEGVSEEFTTHGKLSTGFCFHRELIHANTENF